MTRVLRHFFLVRDIFFASRQTCLTNIRLLDTIFCIVLNKIYGIKIFCIVRYKKCRIPRCTTTAGLLFRAIQN